MPALPFNLKYCTLGAAQVVRAWSKNVPGSAGDTRRWLDPWVWKIPWRRKWQPTPVFLTEESHGQRSLVHRLTSYTVHRITKCDTTEAPEHIRMCIVLKRQRIHITRTHFLQTPLEDGLYYPLLLHPIPIPQTLNTKVDNHRNVRSSVFLRLFITSFLISTSF